MASPHETILFSIPLLRPDELRAAALADQDSGELERAYGPLGISRVSSWVQKRPDYLTVMWEGMNLLDAIKETAVSDDPHFAKWRGLTRIYAGPDPAQAFWDASRHRIFEWSTGERGRDSEARVFHGTESIEEYLRFVQDVQNDPNLHAEFDRIRREQAFTRAELWHQTSGGQDVVISLWEAHDMDAAIAKVLARRTPLDERILEIRRIALSEGAVSDDRPELVMDWRA